MNGQAQGTNTFRPKRVAPRVKKVRFVRTSLRSIKTSSAGLQFGKPVNTLGMTPLGETRTTESWHLGSTPRQLLGVYVMPGSSKHTERFVVTHHA